MNDNLQAGCGCYRGRKARWIEPSVLYLLWQGERHGYELMNDLPGVGFLNGPADPGAVYRMLRHLEDNGLVESEWDTTGSGPAKRLYTITTLGKESLMLWLETLRSQSDALFEFIHKLEKLERDSK